MTPVQGAYSEEIIKHSYEEYGDDILRDEYKVFDKLKDDEDFSNTMVFEYLMDCRTILVEEMASRFQRMMDNVIQFGSK